MANFPPPQVALNRTVPLIVALGDSTTAYNSQLSSASTILSIVSNGDGTATVNLKSEQNIRKGDPIGIQLTSNDKFKVRETLVLDSSASGSSTWWFTYALNPGTSLALNVTEPTGSAILRYPLRGSAQGVHNTVANLLDKRIKFINAGQSGEKIDRTVARFEVDVAPYRPDRVCISIGINDCFSGSSPTPLADMQASMRLLLAKCQSINAKLDIITPIPQGGTRGGWLAAYANQLTAWRRWCIRFAEANGLVCIDWASCTSGNFQVQDATSNPGVLTANSPGSTYATWTLIPSGDKIHQTNLAAFACAKEYASILNVLHPRATGNTAARLASDSPLFTNGGFTGASGTTAITTANGAAGTFNAGPIADTLVLTNSYGSPVITPYQTARTVALDGDTNGNWQGFTFTATAAGDQILIALENIYAKLSNGDTVRVALKARLKDGNVAGSTQFCRDVQLYVNSQTAKSGNLLITDMAAPGVPGQASGSPSNLAYQQSGYAESFTQTLGFDAPVRQQLQTADTPAGFKCTLAVTASQAGTFNVEFALLQGEKV